METLWKPKTGIFAGFQQVVLYKIIPNVFYKTDMVLF